MSEFRDQARQWVDDNVDLGELLSTTNSSISEAIREGYTSFEEDQYIAYIFTLVSGSHGQFIGETVAKEFGIEFDPSSQDDLDWIWYDIEDFASEVCDYLNELSNLDGDYYFENHEADGSYCLFFSKDISTLSA